MTIVEVAGQATGATGGVGADVSKAFVGNLAAGNMIAVFGMRYTKVSNPFAAGTCTKIAGTAVLGAITLDSSLEYVSGTNYCHAGLWSAQVVTGGSCTMQLAGTANSECDMGIDEFHSSDGPLGLITGNLTGSGATGTPLTAAGQATRNALYCAAVTTVINVLTTHTPGLTYTQVYEEEDGANHNTGSCMYKCVGPGIYTADWQAPTAIPWAAALAVYQEKSPAYALADAARFPKTLLRKGVH